MQIFNSENAFWRGMGRIADLVVLNILVLVCALPVITMGASLTAMYSVLLKMAKGEEGTVVRGFFTAFVKNLKSGIILWVPLLAIFAFFICEMNLVRQGVMAAYPMLQTAVHVQIFIVGVVLFMFVSYLFPILARYDNTLGKTVKNSFLLIAASFPQAVLIVFIWLVPLGLMMISNYFLFLWVIYGFTFPGYFCSKILRHVFDKVEEVQG